MSEYPLDDRRFLLDEGEPLGSSYDDEADVLYLWRGERPSEGIALTTDDGHIVRFDPETGEIVGFTILDWAARWQEKERIEIHLPALGDHESADDEEGTTHSLLATAV